MRSVCVFCGSADGGHPDYRQAAEGLADELVRRGTRLVYGGASVGTMEVLADRMLAGGGRVVGVIPRHLAQGEVAHPGLADLRVVDSMHERKALMADLADGFVALPGGLGTLDELAEIVTWRLLGLHAKPTGVLNVRHYFDQLLAFLDHARDEGFLRPAQRDLLLVDTNPVTLLDVLEGLAGPG